MPEQDVVSWTALISGFVADGYGSDGIYLFSVMRNEGIRPNEFSLATCLKACSICLDLEFGKQVHAEIFMSGLLLLTFMQNAVRWNMQIKVFFCMPKQNDVSWNALLNGYAQMGDEEKVLKMFCGIKSKMKYSKFTLSTVLKGFANSRNLGAGRVVHSMAIKIGCELDEFVSCTLVDMYSKCELADDALKVFMRIKNPDKVAWTAMITCFDQQGQKGEAAKLFRLMRKTGLRPNQFTLASIVSSAIDFSPHYGESIHACVYKYGFESENLVCNALITMYMKIESVDDGYRVFDAMSNRDVVSWNALLSGFHDNETFDQGPSIFNQMLVEGFKPNMYTFISILRSCSSLWNVGFGKQVHAHIIKESLDENSFIGTALIDMYAKCKCLGDAEAVFNRSNEKDLFTWTVMISGYAQTDQGEKAIQCFNQMQKEGVKPNEFTLASCLRGSAGIASLENGRLLHSLAIKSGHFGDIFVASALVDMYGKCGSIEDSETFFKGLDFRDTVAWNTIICGYSQHGQADKALEAFKFMLDEGVVPDGVTFLGILSACSHMGLTEEGKKHFTSMSELYGIIPLIEHYACMVDILGRAGKFNEVESFIAQMKLTPNALIWETVLGACKIHGNEEFGERAAEKLFELEPETDSNYILLSNIFAAKGRWGDVSKVRAFMSSRGVKKEPGCSWVEGNAQIHIFLSQDGSHPKILEIYQKLEDLGQKLASIGYIPNTDYLVSHITNREIVIRDIKRFHHFETAPAHVKIIASVGTKCVSQGSALSYWFLVVRHLGMVNFCYEDLLYASNVEQCIKNNMIWLPMNVSKGSCVIVTSPELSDCLDAKIKSDLDFLLVVSLLSTLVHSSMSFYVVSIVSEIFYRLSIKHQYFRYFRFITGTSDSSRVGFTEKTDFIYNESTQPALYWYHRSQIEFLTICALWKILITGNETTTTAT
ncbi:hypothetical protein HYC85_026465 [Camellia sinensis]|uniref:DYW domain-containing protein n=1 Tax=Camellia sinensis TaxID=4442 RepID=A0A7J7G7P7_CAMSI|nr:hypothetical protein HYC85_026465 [Camellia sinensis]